MEEKRGRLSPRRGTVPSSSCCPTDQIRAKLPSSCVPELVGAGGAADTSHSRVGGGVGCRPGEAGSRADAAPKQDARVKPPPSSGGKRGLSEPPSFLLGRGPLVAAWVGQMENPCQAGRKRRAPGSLLRCRPKAPCEEERLWPARERGSFFPDACLLRGLPSARLGFLPGRGEALSRGSFSPRRASRSQEIRGRLDLRPPVPLLGSSLPSPPPVLPALTCEGFGAGETRQERSLARKAASRKAPRVEEARSPRPSIGSEGPPFRTDLLAPRRWSVAARGPESLRWTVPALQCNRRLRSPPAQTCLQSREGRGEPPAQILVGTGSFEPSRSMNQ